MKRRKHAENGLLKDKLAGLVAAYIIRIQLRLCRRLSSWESRRSQVQKKWLFFLFTGICGAYCCYLLITGLNGKTDMEQKIPTPMDSIRSVLPKLPAPGPLKGKPQQQNQIIK